MVETQTIKLSKEKFEELKKNSYVNAKETYGLTETQWFEIFDKIENDQKKILIEEIKNGEYHHLYIGILQRRKNFFSKTGSSKLFDVVFIGKTNINTYGKNKLIERFEKEYKIDRSSCIANGHCNEEGQPLEQYGISKGKPIDKNDIESIKLFGLVSYEDEVYDFIYTLKQENINVEIPLFHKLKINGYSQRKTNFDENIKKNLIISGSVKTLNIEVGEKVGSDFIEKHFQSKFVDNIDEYALNPNKTYDSIFVTKANINTYKTNNKSPSIEFSIIKDNNKKDEVYDYNNYDDEIENKEIFGFISEKSLDMQESACDCYVIGDTYIKNGKENNETNQEDNIGVNIYGVWFPDTYKKIELCSPEVDDEIQRIKNEVKEDKEKLDKSQDEVKPQEVIEKKSNW